MPSFTKVADTTESNAGILGVSHGTTTSLNGQPGTGLLWINDVQIASLRVYKAVPENGKMVLLKSFNVPGVTKFTRPVFGDGIVYHGTTQGYVYGYGAPTVSPLDCASPYGLGTSDLNTATAPVTITCKAKIGVSVTGIALDVATDYTLSGLPNMPLTLATGATFSFKATFQPTSIGLVSANAIIRTTNSAAGYSIKSPVLLTGTGQSTRALLDIDPGTLTFSKVATNQDGGASQSVIFSNLGNTDLTISNIRYSTSSATGPFVSANQIGPFTLAGLPAAIKKNSAATVGVNFSPTTNGNFNLFLVVDSDGGQQVLSITASSGPAPVAKLEFQTPDGTGWVLYSSGANFTFGTVFQSQTLTLKMRLTNTAGTGAVPLSVTVSKPPVGVAGIVGASNAVDLGEGVSLEAGQSAVASLYCSPPKTQWDTDPYTGVARWTMNTNDLTFGKQFIQFVCNAVAEQAPPFLANGQGRYRYVGCFKENNPGRQLAKQLYGDDTNTIAKCIAACAAGNYLYCGTQYNRECWAGPTIPNLKVDEGNCDFPCKGDINEICGGNGLPGSAGGAYISLFVNYTGQVIALSSSSSSTSRTSTSTLSSSTSSTTSSTTTTALGTSTSTSTSTSAAAVATGGPFVNPGVLGFQSLGCYAEPNTGRMLSNQFTFTPKSVAGCAAVCAGKYAYMGLEYGQECWCGNTLQTGGTGSGPAAASQCNKVCVGKFG